MSYRESVKRTVPKNFPFDQYLNMGAMGLAGEVGEVVDLIKKNLFQGKQLDKEKLILELGDARWYMEILCMALGTSLNEIEEKNVDKLNKRYPKGFKVV